MRNIAFQKMIQGCTMLSGERLQPQILFLKAYIWHVLVSLKNNSKSK